MMSPASKVGSVSGAVAVKDVECLQYILTGVVSSRSDAEQFYEPRLVVQVNALCDCPHSMIRGKWCAHLDALLGSLSLDELRQWLKESMEPHQEKSG